MVESPATMMIAEEGAAYAMWRPGQGDRFTRWWEESQALGATPAARTPDIVGR
jgi:hypothetical protein